MRKCVLISLMAIACFAAAAVAQPTTVRAQMVPDPDCGKINDDDRIDLSDAVSLLIWLFLNSEEPPVCAPLVQCKIQMAESQAAVIAAQAERDQALADLASRDARIAELEAALAQKRAELDTCNGQVADCQAASQGCQVELANCQAGLATSQAELDSCQAELANSQAELASCQAESDACQAELQACQGQGGGSGLPATGQADCYDLAGNPIDCSSPEYPGQDGLYQATCSVEDRYTDNGDGTITDKCTGLMWQTATSPSTHVWQAALQYCEALDLAGHGDWRLPNVLELESLVDFGRAYPAMDPVFEAVSSGYWSSTSLAEAPGRAWYVNFGNGISSETSKESSGNVRAVRMAQ